VTDALGKTSGVRFPPPAIYALALGAGFLAHRLWPVALWPDHLRAMRVAGILLFLAGLGIALAAVRTFRATGTSPNPTRPSKALAFAGPYRFTRNPMYLGLFLASAGFAVFWNAFWPLATLPFAILAMTVFVIRREERYLEERFGQPYHDYTRRVRRWL
jgi:protein-S-isoprenylcysteine O-methyltransferase Ste14